MLRNIIYISGSILIFFTGIVLYGVVLNIRVDNLDEAMAARGIKNFTNPRIIISRTSNKLDLYSDTVFVKSYKAVFGRNVKPKTKQGDFGTPRGKYKVCAMHNDNNFYRLIEFNYPTEKDAAEGVKNGYISEEDYKKIKNELADNGCSYAWTNLGGRIGIHGIGEYNAIFKNLPFVFNWTNGSAAVSNESMDELFRVVTVGTEVEIRFK